MKLTWDMGTAYDLFASLFVIHNPGDFGVRASWAAGVRSRIPASSRQLFQDAEPYLICPVWWIQSLPTPKDASAAIRQLESMDPAEVLPALTICPGCKDDTDDIFLQVRENRSWNDTHLDELLGHFKKHGKGTGSGQRKNLSKWLDWWSKPDEFGELYVEGISEYFDNFFREEERRILPAIRAGLEDAQKLASQRSEQELIEELSQGIQSETLLGNEAILLVPSFWITPRIAFGKADKNTGFMQFGARPKDASIIPGETVPDSLAAGLHALSDPTRLRILKLIAAEPLTQTEIAKKLRLRTPTISHHMSALRLASLVVRAYPHGDMNQAKFSLRKKRIKEICAMIGDFLS